MKGKMIVIVEGKQLNNCFMELHLNVIHKSIYFAKFYLKFSIKRIYIHKTQEYIYERIYLFCVYIYIYIERVTSNLDAVYNGFVLLHFLPGHLKQQVAKENYSGEQSLVILKKP